MLTMTPKMDTQIQAYDELKHDNKIGKMQNLVLNGLHTLDLANNAMVAKFLKIPINQVTGRMKELRDEYGFVDFSHKSKCPFSGKITEFWKLTPNGKENAQKIKDVKKSRIEYRPYILIDGFSNTMVKCMSKDLFSHDWHDVEIIISPLGEFKCICDCYNYNHSKQRKVYCKHIEDLIGLLEKDGVINFKGGKL